MDSFTEKGDLNSKLNFVDSNKNSYFTLLLKLSAMLSAVWHRNIFLFALISLACGMMFSAVPTSIPQIILLANWLLEKNYTSKWAALKSNYVFWAIISLFFLHIIGICYTQNIDRGLEDLKVKMPLLFIPLVLFSSSPISFKELRLLISMFLLSVFASSICCYVVYLGFTKKIILDVRNASVFMSHIRFSLYIAFSIIVCGYGLIKEANTWAKIVLIALIIWLLFFMLKLEMATGLAFLLIVSSLLVIYFSTKWLPKKITFVLILALIITSGLIVKWCIESLDMYAKDSSKTSNVLLDKTKSGRFYLQDTVFGLAENGTLITININVDEIKKEWELKSNFYFNGLDKKGNSLYYTLLRYMASKDLTKDSVGISLLSKQDVINIENGNCNYKYNLKSGLASKWRELIWEYTKFKRGENPSGHTLSMRLEFWKTALFIIKNNLVFGVGTGDVQDSFNSAYIETNSALSPEWRLRCHNQYLAIGVAFGLIGFIVFLISLFYPILSQRTKLHYLFWPFIFIVLLSFLTEDTLETQAGVTFFVFFNTLFLWLSQRTESTKY